MNKQFKLNENLFFINGFYHATEDEVIMEGDWFVHKNKWIHCCTYKIQESVYDDTDSQHFDFDCKRIAFSNNTALQVPILLFEHEINFAEIFYNILQKTYPLFDAWEEAREYFKNKRSTRVFTEKDCIGFAEFIKTEQWTPALIEHTWFSRQLNDSQRPTTKELFNIYLQSKETQIESFEVACDEQMELKQTILGNIAALNIVKQ